MSIRDKELQRLINYAKGLGVNVVIKTIPKGAKNHDAGTWSTDGSGIEVFVARNASKTLTILNLIHELGHHLWFIYKKSRTPDLQFDKALEIEGRAGVTPKKVRKKILVVEREGVAYWDIIITDTDIKIPRWKIEKIKEFDIWQYEFYYTKARFPNKKERDEKSKNLTLKYKTGK